MTILSHSSSPSRAGRELYCKAGGNQGQLHAAFRSFSAAFTATAMPPAIGVSGVPGTATRFDTPCRFRRLRPCKERFEENQFS
jgi:hypothetical protein